MEDQLLRFEKEVTVPVEGDDIISSSSSLYDHKLVPWLSWDEWDFVRESLFSSSPKDRDTALKRISAWRGRGSLPVVIDITSAIVEIHQTDPYFRGDQPSNVTHSEQMLAMLYCMAILRLVNCVVEKTRKRSEISIAEAADGIGIPRSLIDLRHEGSHRDLPALPLARDSSVKALNWLKSYYWEPQQRLIPFQRKRSANVRKEIKAKFRELVFCLRGKQHPQSVPSLVQGKHCGRNKLLSLMAGKPRGYKRQITGTVKTLVQLYSSFSSEVVSVLLEFLLKAADSSYLAELPKQSPVEKTHSLLDDWKLVVTKLAKKEPELLLTLLSAILDMIKSQGAMVYETGTQHLNSSEQRTESGQISHLSFLFAWLVGQLKSLKPFCHNDTTPAEVEVSLAENKLSNSILKELLHKCLLVTGCSGNNQLMKSTLLVAELIRDDFLVKKLSKLYRIWMPNSDFTKENISLPSSEDLSQHEESICLAAKKLELVKLRGMKSKVSTTTNINTENSSRWAVAKSWNPCPIGMLPRDLSYSGHPPVLDRDGHHETVNNSSKGETNWELNKCSGNEVLNWELNPCSASLNIHPLHNSNIGKLTGKREASCDTQTLDNPISKKMRETVHKCDGEDGLFSEGIGGLLLIGGVYKKASEEEPLIIRSEVSIWV